MWRPVLFSEDMEEPGRLTKGEPLGVSADGGGDALPFASRAWGRRNGTEKEPAWRRLFFNCRGSAFDRADVRCLTAFRPLGDLELDRLAFAQRTVAVAGDAAVMDENVLAVLLRDEAEALLVAEPLDGSAHVSPPSSVATARHATRGVTKSARKAEKVPFVTGTFPTGVSCLVRDGGLVQRPRAQDAHRFAARQQPSVALQPKTPALLADAKVDRALRGVHDALQTVVVPPMTTGFSKLLYWCAPAVVRNPSGGVSAERSENLTTPGGRPRSLAARTAHPMRQPVHQRVDRAVVPAKLVMPAGDPHQLFRSRRRREQPLGVGGGHHLVG